MTYTEALDAYRIAARAEAAAWGPRGTDGRHALPQAVQLYDRLQVALAADQSDPKVAHAVEVLQGELARARADPDDGRRCAAWQLAWGQYCDALIAVEAALATAQS
jgi:hypothetical protein